MRVDVRVRIGSIVIRCFELQKMIAFWREALRYEVVHAAPEGDFVILGDPDGRGPNVSLDRTPAAAVSRAPHTQHSYRSNQRATRL